MTTYVQAQFNKVRDLASAESETIQFTLQIAGPVGKTNWMNINEVQLNAIQEILEPTEPEYAPRPRRQFYTKARADRLAERYSFRYSTFWYVREVKPNCFEPWAHELGDAVSTFYCGAIYAHSEPQPAQKANQAPSIEGVILTTIGGQ